MNHNSVNDWRARRNLLNHHINGSNHNFSARPYSIFNYSTKDSTTDIKDALGKEMFIGNLHMIKDPLKKNLADTLVTGEKKADRMAPKTEHDEDRPNNNQSDFYASLAGIGSFISGVFNVISGVMFHKRAASPATQYYDCFDNSFVHEESPALETWQPSKYEVENKNGRAGEQFKPPNDHSNTNVNPSTMTSECRTVATHCESKINQVRLLLSNKTSTAPTTKFRRRPRRIFIEPGSVEDIFEDAFAPEDFQKLANELYIQCVSPYNCQNQELLEVDAPIMKTEFAPVQENMEIVKCLPQIKNDNVIEIKSKIINDIPAAVKDEKQQVETENIATSDKINSNLEIVSFCEDKVNKLKAMFLERRKNNKKTVTNCSDSITEPAKVHEQVIHRSKAIPAPKVQDKHFKNPHRLSRGKRTKTQMHKDILDDMTFVDEIDRAGDSSIENSPSVKGSVESHLSGSASTGDLDDTDYFNELTGRFHSSSTTESDDSFQIVFNESPPIPRLRKVSDCDSEDSFIVFEDSPDNCYISNDVFGDEMSDTENNDSDSDSDISDSGCESNKLTHSMSKTLGDLTDDSLYEDESRKCGSDEVDCAVKVMGEEISNLENEIESFGSKTSKGVLVDETRKKHKKTEPPKKVQFSPLPPKVHVMRVWTFAARQARAGNWERLALDRDRFKRRIADVDMAISWVLKPQHRTRIMFQRFMPWWNAQKRRELAEKKERENQEAKLREVEGVVILDKDLNSTKKNKEISVVAGENSEICQINSNSNLQQT